MGVVATALFAGFPLGGGSVTLRLPHIDHVAGVEVGEFEACGVRFLVCDDGEP